MPPPPALAPSPAAPAGVLLDQPRLAAASAAPAPPPARLKLAGAALKAAPEAALFRAVQSDADVANSLLRCTVLQQRADGVYAAIDPAAAALDRDARVRLVMVAAQPGQLAVMGGSRVLYTAAAAPGRRYTFDPPGGEDRLTLTLTPAAARVRAAGVGAPVTVEVNIRRR
jgi:hypothetical protein